MHRQGYDVQLTQYDERGWRATFYMTGMEHPATSASASAFEETPWRAVQRAAWDALTKTELEDAQTTLLYALSTFAQTCAALAAFVGAVGLLRLQALGTRRRQLEDELRDWLAQLRSRVDVPVLTMAQIVSEIKDLPPGRTDNEKRLAALSIIETWQQIPGAERLSRRALLAFELWNLIVIAGALLGFNYVAALAASSVTWWAVWAGSIGTVVITIYAVYAWTRA